MTTRSDESLPGLYGERLAELGVVEIVITTAAELLPGATVTGLVE